MSNPFPKLIVKEVTNGTLTRGKHNLFLFTPEHDLFRNPTAEQIRYAARAINQHEAMVVGLQLAMEWLDEVCNANCEDLRTPEGMEVHDKLAALLAEEES